MELLAATAQATTSVEETRTRGPCVGHQTSPPPAERTVSAPPSADSSGRSARRPHVSGLLSTIGYCASEHHRESTAADVADATSKYPTTDPRHWDRPWPHWDKTLHAS